MSDAITIEETLAAMRHLEECGAFCAHIVFCPKCVDVYGLCASHRVNEAGRAWFQRPSVQAKDLDWHLENDELEP